MLELIRSHCKEKHQDCSSALLQEAAFQVVYGARPLVGLGYRSQQVLMLSCQTLCQKGLANAKCWPCKWFMVKLATRVGALTLE